MRFSRFSTGIPDRVFSSSSRRFRSDSIAMVLRLVFADYLSRRSGQCRRPFFKMEATKRAVAGSGVCDLHGALGKSVSLGIGREDRTNSPNKAGAYATTGVGASGVVRLPARVHISAIRPRSFPGSSGFVKHPFMPACRQRSRYSFVTWAVRPKITG
jgi:hypothetical protein